MDCGRVQLMASSDDCDTSSLHRFPMHLASKALWRESSFQPKM